MLPDAGTISYNAPLPAILRNLYTAAAKDYSGFTPHSPYYRYAILVKCESAMSSSQQRHAAAPG
jgi:hypothetical protein